MYNIYTDIDSILDTRHPMIFSLNQDLAKEVITSGRYKSRKKDSFGNVSMDIFRTIYRHRNKELLYLSKPTHICGLLSNHIFVELRDQTNDGVFNLYVNIYPYDLNLDEQNNLLELLIRMVPEFIGIKIINCTNDEIDPDWILQNEIKTMFMYEALSWLEYQHASTKILTNPLTNVFLYGPDVVDGNMKEDTLSPEFFKNLIVMFSGIINYLPVEIKYFNTVLDI